MAGSTTREAPLKKAGLQGRPLSHVDPFHVLRTTRPAMSMTPTILQALQSLLDVCCKIGRHGGLMTKDPKFGVWA